MKKLILLAVVQLFLFIPLIVANSCGILTSIGDISPPMLNTLVNSDIVFNCTLNPDKYNSSDISFSLYEEPIDKSHVTIINKHTAQLRISNATQYDSGRYYCLVHHGNKNIMVCVSEAKVGFKPEDAPVKQLSCVYKLGQEIKCWWPMPKNSIPTKYILRQVFEGIDHYCPPSRDSDSEYGTCLWSKNIKKRRHFPKHVDRYDFIMLASNMFGKFESPFSFDLSAIVKLDPPRDLSFDKESNTLSWSYPTNIEMVNKSLHLLQFKVVATNIKNGHSSFIYLNYTQTSVQLELKPYSIFNFSISCKMNDPLNENWSELSSIISSTNEDVPASPPQIINQAFTTTSDLPRSATIYWKSLPENLKNSANISYLITYFDGGSNVEANITTKSTTATFGQLQHAPVEFRIYSFNSVGLSRDFSRLILPAKDHLLQPPVDIVIHMDIKNEKAIYEVTWNSNSSERSLQNYTVFWCIAPAKDCTSDIQWQFVTDTRLDINLPQRLDYKFGVAANSEHSSSGIRWTDCVINSDKKIKNLNHASAQSHGPTSVLLKWDFLCEAQQKFVDGFNVTYCLTDDCKDDNQKFKNISTGSFLLENLKPNSTYKIVLSSTNVESSNVFIVRTDLAIPSGPLDLSVIQNQNFSIINWNSSPDTNDHFKIQFLNDTFQTTCHSATCNFTVPHGQVLQAFTDYTISLFSCNKKGICSLPAQRIFRTAPSRPGRMSRPKVDKLGPSKYRVHFKHPDDANGPIDYYYLKRKDNPSKVQRFSGNDKFADLAVDCESEFSPQIYEIAVLASNVVNGTELQGELSEWNTFGVCSKYSILHMLIFAIIIIVTICAVVFLSYVFKYIAALKKEKKELKIMVECNKPHEMDQLNSLLGIDYLAQNHTATRKASSSIDSALTTSNSSLAGTSHSKHPICPSTSSGSSNNSTVDSHDLNNCHENLQYFTTKSIDESSKPLLAESSAEPMQQTNNTKTSPYHHFDVCRTTDLNQTSVATSLNGTTHNMPKPALSTYVPLSPVINSTSHYVPHSFASAQTDSTNV